MILGKEGQANVTGTQGMQPQPAPGTNPGQPQAKATQGGKIQMTGKVYRSSVLEAEQQINSVWSAQCDIPGDV